MDYAKEKAPTVGSGESLYSDTVQNHQYSADNPFNGVTGRLALDGTGHALGFYATHSSTAPSNGGF